MSMAPALLALLGGVAASASSLPAGAGRRPRAPQSPPVRRRIAPKPSPAVLDLAHGPGPSLEVALLDEPLSPAQAQAWLDTRERVAVENRPLEIVRFFADKPAGGVAWTSQQRSDPEDFISEWAEFACTVYEGACVPYAMLFSPAPEARILDLDEALALGGRGVVSSASGRELIDWEGLARAGVDAVHYSSTSRFLDGWDVESTVWLSPGKLRALRLVHLDRGRVRQDS